MPLFKFRELLETRYRSSVSVSELYKLRDVCFVSEETCGRMISLSPDLRTTPSPHLNSQVSTYTLLIYHTYVYLHIAVIIDCVIVRRRSALYYSLP